MRYNALLLWLSLLLSTQAAAQQQAITLDDCLAAAMKNHPLAGQNEIYAQTDNLQQRNIDNGKLPQLNVNGQAT